MYTIRRFFRSQRSWVVRLLAVSTIGALMVSGSIGGSPAGASKPPTTLHLAMVADMGPPDPDIYYGSEGLAITTALYQGLLQYQDNSTKIVGDLAASYTISPDRLTYTFHLQPNVHFHDGTSLTSAAVAFSFQRRTAINQGPAYMLADVKSVATPDPLTAVVQLTQPVSAFLDYLASPYGPKMVGPTTITAHTVNNDYGQQWLASHDAGTGPYEISSWETSQRYVLTAYPGYWGPRPAFHEDVISIIPDISTQQIELKSGQLDMILHGLLPTTARQLGQSGFVVHSYTTLIKGMIFVNPHRGPFVSVAARQALARTLNKKAITTAVYGSAGTPSTQLYPAGELSSTLQTSVVPYNPSKLKSMAPLLPTRKVDIGYDPTDPRDQLLAELVQVALNADGLQATTRSIPLATIFSLSSDPATAPDILIQTNNPDAAHPDTWARIYMSKGGGANYLQCWSNQADALMDQGLSATTLSAVDQSYGQAGNLLVKDGCFIDIADVQDTIVSRPGITGFHHVPSIPWTVNLGLLRPTGTS
jgi:peptide/nickel transport system substrate-binding protein